MIAPRPLIVAALAACLAAPAAAVPLRVEFDGVLASGDPADPAVQDLIGAPGRLVVGFDDAAEDLDPADGAGVFRDAGLSAELFFAGGAVPSEDIGTIKAARLEVGEGEDVLRFGALTAFLPIGSAGRTTDPFAGLYVQVAGRSFLDADRLPGPGALEPLLASGGGMFALQFLADRDADLVFRMTAVRVLAQSSAGAVAGAEAGPSPVSLPASGWGLVLALGAVAAARRLRR